MQHVIKTLSDIFSMSFDIIMPLSGCIVALLVAVVLFSIRYFSFKYNKRKYERKQARASARAAAPVPAAAAAASAAAVAAPMVMPVAARKAEPALMAPVLVAAETCDDLVMNIMLSAVGSSKAALASADSGITSAFGSELERATLGTAHKRSREIPA